MAYQRPSTTSRDYGRAHQLERARWQARLDAGETVVCPMCDQLPLITKDTAWDLGHNADRTRWIGPCHRDCNRSDGARRRNKIRSENQLVIRQW